MIASLVRPHDGAAGQAELARTRPQHARTLAEADKVIESYRRLDLVLVARKPRTGR